MDDEISLEAFESAFSDHEEIASWIDTSTYKGAEILTHMDGIRIWARAFAKALEAERAKKERPLAS